MVVPITNVVKITLSVADISVELIIGTPLCINITELVPRFVYWLVLTIDAS